MAVPSDAKRFFLFRGHRTSMIRVKSRQSCSNEHLPYLARSLMHDVACEFAGFACAVRMRRNRDMSRNAGSDENGRF